MLEITYPILYSQYSHALSILSAVVYIRHIEKKSIKTGKIPIQISPLKKDINLHQVAKF